MHTAQGKNQFAHSKAYQIDGKLVLHYIVWKPPSD